MRIDANTRALLLVCLATIAAKSLVTEFLASTARAEDRGAVGLAKINDATASLNILKVAVVDHYAKFGSFPAGNNTFELTLVQEGLLANSFSVMSPKASSDAEYHVRVMKALSPSVPVTATNAAYNFNGGPTNQATGAVVVEAVLFNVASAEARELSLRLDGPELSSAIGRSDLKGRVKFGAIPINGFGEVHVYFIHR